MFAGGSTAGIVIRAGTVAIVMIALAVMSRPSAAGTGLYDFSIYPEFSGLADPETPAPTAVSPVIPDQPSVQSDSTVSQSSPQTAEVDAGDDPWISELRFGVLAHNFGPLASKTESGIDVNPEILFHSPDFLAPIWEPRPMLGATINTIGDTSILYGGLMWTFDLWWDTFIDFSFGMAVHDGNSGSDTDEEGRRALGCSWLFRESIELGYRFDSTYAVALYLDHVSHGGLCDDRNRGMDNSGIRLHYAF